MLWLTTGPNIAYRTHTSHIQLVKTHRRHQHNDDNDYCYVVVLGSIQGGPKNKPLSRIIVKAYNTRKMSTISLY